jgi:hypothetical protein
MEEGGVAATKIVARDLKAMGLYTARALSFAGVEYEPLVHKLTSDRSPFTMPSRTHGPSCIGISKRCSRRQTSSIAYRARPSDSRAKGSALSRFESSKQRFWLALFSGDENADPAARDRKGNREGGRSPLSSW